MMEAFHNYGLAGSDGRSHYLNVLAPAVRHLGAYADPLAALLSLSRRAAALTHFRR